MWNLCCLQIKHHHNKQKVRRIVSFYVCCYNVTWTTTSALSSTLFSHLWTHKRNITDAHSIFALHTFHSRKIFNRQLRMNQAWYEPTLPQLGVWTMANSVRNLHHHRCAVPKQFLLLPYIAVSAGTFWKRSKKREHMFSLQWKL